MKRKNRHQIRRAERKALSARMNAGKARKRMERPAPDYPPMIDATKPFFRATLEFGNRVEQWSIYPGKRRAHRVVVEGGDPMPGGQMRYSVSAVSAEFRKRLAMVERGLRLPVCKASADGEDAGQQR